MANSHSTEAAQDGDTQSNNLLSTYICTEPFGRSPLVTESGSADVESILGALQLSMDFFSKQDRQRTVERIQLEIARISMLHSMWSAALQVLLPLWRNLSWRRSGWFALLAEVDWALRECARHIGDGRTLVTVEWELLCHYLTPRSHYTYDFINCLVGLENLSGRPKVATSSSQILSCISATFAFTVANGHVGEALPFQLVITSLAHQASRPIILSHLRLTFEGGLRDVVVQHDNHIDCQLSTNDGLVHLYEPALQREDSDSLHGLCNLSVSPGTVKVFSLSALPLDAGRVEVSQVILCVEAEEFDFEIAISGNDSLHQKHTWVADEKCLCKSEVQSERSTTINVLPKPPRIRIELPNLAKTYFTGEYVSIEVHVINEEEEEIIGDLDVKLSDQADSHSILSWATMPESASHAVNRNDDGILRASLGSMAPSAKQCFVFQFQAKLETAQGTLEVQARYFLSSDTETPVSKAVSADMHFMRPLEANFNFVPQILLHKQWPSYFHIDEEFEYPRPADDEDARATGLSQRWTVTAAIASFASTNLILESLDLQLAARPVEATCVISADSSTTNSTLSPHNVLERAFMMELQKLNLDDRRTTYFDLQLRVCWRRDTPDAPCAMTFLHLPELAIPFGEPRVLASARYGGSGSPLVHLDYVIENPSMHVLSFSVTMDASEDFAFSGPKATAVQLVPYSCHTIRYRVLSLFQGRWIYPSVRIVDVHWNKCLKVNATRGIKSDKKGIAIWIDAEG